MDSWSLTLSLIAVVLALAYWFLIWNLSYWRKRGVKVSKGYPLIGSFPSLLTQKRHMIYDIDELYRKYKNSENFIGVFTMRSPQLLILNPSYIHRVYVNDFKSFHDNQMSQSVNEKNDLIFANNPFILTGEQWKERRNEIVPGLTTNRIKSVYPVTLEVCQRLLAYVQQQMKMNSKDGLDIYGLTSRYTSEVVSDCVLGIKADSFTEKPSPIWRMTNKLFEQTGVFMVYDLIAGILPSLRKIYKMRFFTKEMEDFFINLLQQSIELRRQQKEDRNDFLNYLLQLQDKKGYTTSILTSHVMTYMTDGFLTTSLAISHCLLALARDPERQARLRQEILQNLSEDGNLSFETLMELPYLDACLHETLRLFTPLPFINKICTAPCELANKDGKVLKLEKDDIVMIPIYCVHNDENFYDEPKTFKPERYLPENSGVKKYREQGLYLGFGDGARICLGMRFALAQSKAAIAEIIKNYKLKPNPKTRKDNYIDKNSFLGALDAGVWLDFEAIV